jgi:aldose 1-epimerase
MAFEVRIRRAEAGGRAGDVHELAADDDSVRAEVWPQWGFNCLRWQVRQPDDRWGSILYTAGDWEMNPVPTRSGQPILFPFPGRMRDGRFTFEGKVYQLPATERNSNNAIHGFSPRAVWRVIDWNGDDEFAFVTGQFNLKKDSPENLPHWPADFNLNVTYRLYRDRLRVDAAVENLGPGPLPFGLGYHPYFRLPGLPEAEIEPCILQAHVEQLWETENNLPTGWRRDIPAAIDFLQPTPLGATQLDNAFTSPPRGGGGLTDLREMAVLSHPQALGRLRVLADPSFRDLVLFTPPHRQAVAIEPYTCSADAANLAERGIDSGWKVIPAGANWEASVEYRWEPVEL